jgi:hypothetical protein
MQEQKPNMFIPALVGGALAGVLSGIPIVNCLCCLWIIGGGMLAAHLLVKDSATPMGAGEGAIVGALSGIVAAVVDTLVSIPFQAMSSEFIRRMMERIAEYADEMPEGWEQWLERGMGEISAPWFLLGFLITVVIFSAFGALGGIIGMSLFGKKRAPSGSETIDVQKKDSGDSQS